MNVFEDLVVELKEQNLLEETIMGLSVPGTRGNGKPPQGADHGPGTLNGSSSASAEADWDLPATIDANSKRRRPGVETVRRSIAGKFQALQFADYVLSAADKRPNVPKAAGGDDLHLKKALHTFAQFSGDTESDEFFEAECSLISQLEAWEAALAERDRNISVEALRNYAEHASPPLSPQTLFALIRFYRDQPCTRETRSKFDFVVTRLFSKFADRDQRDLLCPRAEIVKHLKGRYSDWDAGTAATRSASSDTSPFVLSFDDFIAEINSAKSLAEMRSSDLFKRICDLKESAGDEFFLPEVVAAAIECNVLIANKVIDLVWMEMQRSNGPLPAKYFKFEGDTLSEAAARTIELSKLQGEIEGTETLSAPKPISQRATPSTDVVRPKPARVAKAGPKRTRGSYLLGVNRWLLLTTVIVVIASIGIYVWSEYMVSEDASTIGVKVVDLDKPELKQYIKVSKVSGNMLYAVVTDGFEKLNADGQREYLQKVLQAGPVKGYAKVTFLNEQGKQIAYGSAERIEVPQK